MFGKFRQRSHELERLDTGDYTPEEYSRWQREMEFIHGTFGEWAALEKTLIKDIEAKKLDRVSILDIGAGTGAILRRINDRFPEREMFLVGCELATDALAGMSEAPDLHPVACSGVRLPFADYSIDYAICTLMLHHLSDDDAAKLVQEMCRVSRRRFFIVDLNRHPVGYYGYKLISRFLFQKFTREDGALSILRSFTPDEMLKLARDAGVSEAKVQHSTANRLVLSGR